MLRHLLHVAGVFLLVATAAHGDDTKDIRDLVRKGSDALAKGACRDAETSFRRASGTANSRAGVLEAAEISRIELLLGESNLCLGKVSDARVIGDEVLKRNPPDTIRGMAEFLLAEAQAALGQFEEAERNYASALEASRRAESEVAIAVVLARMSALKRLRGDYSAAEALLAEAQKTLGDQAARPFGAVLVAVETGDLARSRENFEPARKSYESAIALAKEKMPDHPLVARAQLGLGEILLAEYDLAGARRLLGDAQGRVSRFASSPEYLSTADALARVAMANEDFARAADELNSCLTTRKGNLGEASPETAESLDHLGWLQLLQGGFEKASDNLTRAAQIRLKLFGADHQDVASSQLHLGVLSRKQQKLAEAERFISDALRIQTARLGQQSLAAAASRLELARVYLEEKKNDPAEASLRQALVVEEKRLGPRHPVLLSTLATLGALLHQTRRDSEAEPLLARWMKEAGNSPAGSIEGAQAVQAMAEIDLASSRYAEAERRFGQVLAAQTKAGRVEPELHRKLAESLEGQGKGKEAIVQYEDSLARGAPSPASVQVLRHIAALYSTSENWIQAATAYRKSLEMLKASKASGEPIYGDTLLLCTEALLQVPRIEEANTYGAEWMGLPAAGAELRGDQVRTLDHLAATLAANGKPAEAERYLRLLLISAEKSHSTPLMDNIVVRLADACVSAGKSEDAAGLYERAANVRIATRRYQDAEGLLLKAKSIRETNSNRSMEYASTLQSLSYVYLQERKFSSAKPLLEQSRAMLAESGKPSGPSMASVLDGLGVVAKSEQAYDEAGNLYNEANRILKTSDAPKAVVSTVLFHLGELAEANNNTQLADQYFTQCLSTARDSYSPDNPPAVEQFDSIADIYLRHGRYDEAEKLHESTLKLRQEFFGQDSIEATWGLQGLASFYGAHKQFDKAVRAGEEALKLAEKNTGTDSEVTRVVLGTVADAYKNSGDLVKAVAARIRVLEILNKSRHSREEETTQLIDLADYCREAKQYAKAAEFYKRIAKLWTDQGYQSPYYVQGMRGSTVPIPLYQGDVRASQDGYRQLSKDLSAARQGMQRTKLMESYRDALRQTGHEKEAKGIERDLAAPNTTPAPR